SCGSQMPANARFCPDCGHANTSAAATATPADEPQAVAPGAQAQAPGQPPAYSPEPMRAGQGAPSTAFAPPPQYGKAQNSGQYGAGLQPQSQAPVQGYSSYAYQTQAGVAGTQPRDPTIALLLELLGYVGF